jgi:hypothetical protein
MKKIIFLQIAVSASLITIFNGCSGGSNSIPLMPQAGSIGFNASDVCEGEGINADFCAQNFELTSNKNAEYQGHCLQPTEYNSQTANSSTQLCHLPTIIGAETLSVNLPNTAEATNDNGVPILNPNSHLGGLPTGITVYPGDLLTIKMIDGHYSTRPSIDNCSNDVSVDGLNGEKSLMMNPQNGMQAGAYIEFVDITGARSMYQAIGRTAVRISIPTTGAQNNPLTVLVGYNASALACGDVKISYRIKRCMDSSLNTYDCSKL